MMNFSHLDNQGKPKMVDITDKPDERREAIAEGKITLGAETIKAIKAQAIKKGNVMLVAQIAGIQAAKKTFDAIPLCHPLQLTRVDVKLELTKDGMMATSSVVSLGKTGVEMEALHAASVALLTVYDMCKSMDKEMEIGQIRLLKKTKTPKA